MKKRERGRCAVDKDGWREAPLAEMEDPEELKRRYRAISSEVLRRWMGVVVGPHRSAMAAVLAEREK